MSIKSIVNMYTLTKEYKNAVTKFNRADKIEFNTYLKMNIGCKLSSIYRKTMDSEKYDYLKAKYDKYVNYDVLDKIITISKNKKNQQTSFTDKKEDIISETVETKVEEIKEQPKVKEEVKHVEEYNTLVYLLPDRRPYIPKNNEKLSDFVKETGTIFLTKSESKVKIQMEKGSPRTFTINLTTNVLDILPYVANKLNIHCQTEQYCLYYYDDDRKVPLNTRYGIAAQTSNYKYLFFYRRYYQIYKQYFNDRR